MENAIFYKEIPASKEYFDAFIAQPGIAEYWQTCLKTPFHNKYAKYLGGSWVKQEETYFPKKKEIIKENELR